MPCYIVIENTPGYMPEEEDPYVTESYYAAVMVWDDSKTHDLGRYIGVELLEEDA